MEGKVKEEKRKGREKKRGAKEEREEGVTGGRNG